MRARLRKLLSTLGETFWLLPAAMVLAGLLGAVGLVSMDASGMVPRWLIRSPWLYNGGGTGARTLLGAVASSTIGVAGTVFSITIASLSLAAGQMGPRLLRNFTRDRGNQFTLGVFLGTFSYALMVLRSVRTEAEGAFVPHLALSIGIGLALVCVGTLVFFVGHMAGRINVDTVIGLVASDVAGSMRRLTTEDPPPAADARMPDWSMAGPVVDTRRGYLQQLDRDSLADWAARHGTAIRLLVRPGDQLYPGTPVALAMARPGHAAADQDWLAEVAAAVRDATALGPHRISAADPAYAVRQLVEVAVRALSPGINDPHTAMSVLDRLGVALCDLAPRHLPGSIDSRDGRVVLVVPVIDYDGLSNVMFHMIRQNADGSAAVLIRMLKVLASVLACERDPARIATLRRHADLVIQDAEREVANPSDLHDVRRWRAAVDQAGGRSFAAPGSAIGSPVCSARNRAELS